MTEYEVIKDFRKSITQFSRIKGRGASGHHPPPSIVLKNQTYPQQATIRWKGNLKVRFILNVVKNILIEGLFLSGFRDFGQIQAIFER